MSLIDPTGFYTEVIIWDPAHSLGSSSFGHVSTIINGVSYSFGPKGWDVRQASQYLDLNTLFRSGTGYVLPLSTLQETALKNSFINSQSGYNFLTNNCGTPVQNGLSNIGVNLGNNLFPSSIGNALGNVPGSSTVPHPEQYGSPLPPGSSF